MMKKYTLLYSAVVALALVSCDYNEDNFDGFEDFGKPTDIKKGNITFTDWASLKGNPKTNQYFSAADEAQDYLPNWLACATLIIISRVWQSRLVPVGFEQAD